jgi:hypothetical protein
MNFTGNTFEILAWKALNRNVDMRWVDWAVQMLEEGFETPSLIILAGQSAPFNQFEMHALTTKVFNELELDYSNLQLAVENYTRFLIDQTLIGEIESLKTLRILKNICSELDLEKSLYDFYLLCYAKEDIAYSGDQHYWPGARKDTIDKIILDYFNQWKLEHPAHTSN